MPIQTPWSYVEVAELNKDNAAFTEEQYDDLVFSCTNDPVLARLLNLFSPETHHNIPFKTKYNRARDLHQEVLQRENRPIDVHDPLFGSIRQKTKAWLQKTVGSQSSSSSSSSSSSASSASASSSSSLVDTLIQVFKPYLSSEKEIREDQEAFFWYLDQNYQKKGITGKESLEQALAYGASAKDATEKNNRYELLFGSLEQARTAYEGDTSKYILAADSHSQKKARNWSCMPGVEERILDGCTPWLEEAIAKVPAAASGTPEDDFIALLLAQLVHPFLSQQAQGLVPSKEFYSLVLQAVTRHFNWQAEVTELIEYQFSLNEAQQEQYKHALLAQKEQKKQLAEQLLEKLQEDKDFAALSEDEKTALTRLFVPTQSKPSVQRVKRYLKQFLQSFEKETSQDQLAQELQKKLERRYSSKKEVAQQLINAFTQEEMSSLIQPVKIPQLRFSKAAASSSSSSGSGKDEEGLSLTKQPSSSSSEPKEVLQEEELGKALAILDSQTLLTLLQTTYPQLSSEHWRLLFSILPFEVFKTYFLQGNTDYFDPDFKEEAIKAFLNSLQGELLAAELQTQEQVEDQTYTPFYRYYAFPTKALLDHIQNQVLTEIRQTDMGEDYFQNILVPCQEELMIEVIPSCLKELANASFEQQCHCMGNLSVWLQYGDYSLALVELGAYYLSHATLNTSANRKALLAAGENVSEVAESLWRLAEAKLLTQDNFQALLDAGANVIYVARGLYYLAKATLLTTENCQALLVAGANAEVVSAVEEGLDELTQTNILTQDNFLGTVENS